MEKYIMILLPMLSGLIGTALILRFLIPVLKSRKMGQKILDIGPRWHKDKEGTPTMGGISFLVFVPICTVPAVLWLFFSGIIEKKELLGIILTVSFAILSGIIGVTDDLCKLKKKKNEGLTAGEKYLFQLIISALFVAALSFFGVTDTSVLIPFTDITLELGVFWYILSVIFLTGFTNAVNLTDGIDGLSGSVTAAVSLFFTLYLIKTVNLGGVALSSALLGGCIGFLIYNLHPARVFMGDTGSLFLGATVSGLSLALGNPIILFLVGFIYLLEAASVIIQVLFFKLTGKRVFLMAPIHHHFEKKGMSENKITALFVFTTLVVSAFAYIFA